VNCAEGEHHLERHPRLLILPIICTVKPFWKVRVAEPGLRAAMVIGGFLEHIAAAEYWPPSTRAFAIQSIAVIMPAPSNRAFSSGRSPPIVFPPDDR
jgi:hypothetical protein